DTSNVKSFDYTSRFARLAVRYRAVTGATQLTIMPSVGIDDVSARANHNDIDKGLDRTTIPLALRAEVATPLGGGTLLVGVDGGASHHAYHMRNTPPPNPRDMAPATVLQRDL